MTKLIGVVLVSALSLALARAGDPTPSTALADAKVEAGLEWIPAESDLVLAGPVHVVSRLDGRGPRRGGLVVDGAVVTWDSSVLEDGSAISVGTTILSGALANRSPAGFSLVDGDGQEHVLAPTTVVVVGVDVHPGDDGSEAVVIVPSVNLKTASVAGFGRSVKLVKKCTCRCGPTGPFQQVTPPDEQTCAQQNGKVCTDAQGEDQWEQCKKRFFNDNVNPEE